MKRNLFLEHASSADNTANKKGRFEEMIADIAFNFSLPEEGTYKRVGWVQNPPNAHIYSTVPTPTPPPALHIYGIDTPPPISPPVSPSKFLGDIDFPVVPIAPEEKRVYSGFESIDRDTSDLGDIDFPVVPIAPEEKWMYIGFESIDRDTSDLEKDFKYRRWQAEPSHHVSKEEQQENIRHVLQMTLHGKYKFPWWKPMLDKVLDNGNEWMESREFFTMYTSGREKANAGIFYDPKNPRVSASRLHIVDERRYKINKGTFFEQIKRQLRVNPMHLEIYKEMVNEIAKDD